MKKHLSFLFSFTILFGLNSLLAEQIDVNFNDNLIQIINSSSTNDTINVFAGTYSGGTITKDNIHIRGVEPNVFISSYTQLNADEVNISNMHWDGINGTLLEIKGKNNIIDSCSFLNFGHNSTSKGIWIREDGDYSGNVITNCLFKDWGSPNHHSSCIKVGQVGFTPFEGTIIRNNVFENGAVGGNSPSIQLFFPTLVEGNEISECEDGVEVKGSNNIIRGNIVHHCYGDEAMSNRVGSNNLFEKNILYSISSYVWQIWDGSDNVWRNNIIYNSERIAHIKGGSGSDGNAINVLLINNTFVNTDRGISWDLKDNPPQNIQLVNNIFVGDGSTYIESAGLEYISVCDHNHFYNFGTHGTNFTTGEPLFENESLFDFRLTSESPCVDAGLSTYNQIPSDDFDNNQRPIYDSQVVTTIIDIGAFEYVDSLITDILVDAVLSENFIVYPNPNNGIFTVSFIVDEDVELSVVDISGKNVYSKLVAESNEAKLINKEINLQDLSSGVYYVKVMSDNINYVKKVVIVE